MRAKSRLKSPTSTRRALDANIKTVRGSLSQRSWSLLHRVIYLHPYEATPMEKKTGFQLIQDFLVEVYSPSAIKCGNVYNYVTN